MIMAPLNQSTPFFATLTILILMFMADSNSAVRIYSYSRIRRNPQGGVASNSLTADGPLNLPEATFHDALKGHKDIPPSGPSHRGHAAPIFTSRHVLEITRYPSIHHLQSVPSPGAGN